MYPYSNIKTSINRSEYANTLVTELDLVCDYAQWPHISTSLFYVGSLLGNIIFGNIADRFRMLEVIIKDMSICLNNIAWLLKVVKQAKPFELVTLV